MECNTYLNGFLSYKKKRVLFGVLKRLQLNDYSYNDFYKTSIVKRWM
jgi:hypothetical protein